MKNLIFFLVSFYSITNGFSQEINPEKRASEYRKMSKSQQISGIIFLAGGLTTLAFAAEGDISLDALPAVIILGSVATIGGTGLLIASGKNGEKSRNLGLSLSFKQPTFETVQNVKSTPFPSISLKLKL